MRRGCSFQVSPAASVRMGWRKDYEDQDLSAGRHEQEENGRKIGGSERLKKTKNGRKYRSLDEKHHVGN